MESNSTRSDKSGVARPTKGGEERGEDVPVKATAVWKSIAMSYVRRLVPVTQWARTLTPRIALGDCVSGFIVGVMIVPTSLSWSSLAGIPLSCGLVAALIASFSYGTFGQCACLSIGPVAEITTLLISIPGSPYADRESAFQSLGVQVGILSMALSFIDCGTVIKTIFAKAVGDGYTCAAALLAIAAQLQVMFNVNPEDKGYGNFINTVIAMGKQWRASCLYCFALFLVYCTYLIQIKKTRLPLWIPHQLIVVVVSIFVTRGFRLDQRWNMAIVKEVPASLSLPHFPPMKNLIQLGPYTLTITVISFVQMYVVAQRVMPDIDPNAELFAGGIINLLVNLMSGMPVSNSFSCSSVLIEQKAQTPLTAYAAGTVVLITILFFTRLGVFYYLPKQALAAIVVASVWRLVNFSGPAQLWRYSRKDASVWVLTFVLTVIGGITIGVLSGIAFSLILVVLRIARPRAVSVGFNMQTFRYGDIRKDPELLVYPNILMWRFDAPLYFINTTYFQERLQAAIAAEVRPIDVVLVTCGKVVDIDAAALASLPSLLDAVSKSDTTRPRRIILTDIHGRLEKVLLDSSALPIYVPEEYDRLSIEQINASGKFPVVFKKLEDAIAFAQRCISERYGNVDTAPYPNVSFLTDVVVAAARLPTKDGCAPSLLTLLEADNMQSSSAPAKSSTTAAVGGQQRRRPSRSGSRKPSSEGLHIVVTAPGETPPPCPLSPQRCSRERKQEAAVASSKQVETKASGAEVDNVAASTDDHQESDVVAAEHEQAEEQDSLVRHLATLKKLSTYSPDRELVGVLGVIRHSEVTPKQKKKLVFSDPLLIRQAFHGFDVQRTRRSVEDLSEFFATVERMLQETGTVSSQTMGGGSLHSSSPDDNSLAASMNLSNLRFTSPVAENWARVLAIVRSRPEGLKIQIKAPFYFASSPGSFLGTGAGEYSSSPSHPVYHSGDGGAGGQWLRVNQGARSPIGCSSASGAEDDEVREPVAGLLVVKWGGVLTRSGITQAHVMGERLFARFYAAGDLPLYRLVQFTRQPRVTASDEVRVVNTALVVANALTQSSGITVRRGDVQLDDKLTKTLGFVAKRLLREEYKYFESLLHIESAAVARHFFHIPGFRQLLWIPPLDHPFPAVTGGDANYFNDSGVDNQRNGAQRETSSNKERDNQDKDGRRDNRGFVGDGDTGDGSAGRREGEEANPRSFGFHGQQSTSFMHPGCNFYMLPEQQQHPNFNVLRQDEFYTPYQVLQELEELMTTMSTIEFPSVIAKIPLSNHETLQEVQQRYDAMLNNYLGAKRRIRNGAASPGPRDTKSADSAIGDHRYSSTGNVKDLGAPVRALSDSALDNTEGSQMVLVAMEEMGRSSDDEGVDNQILEDAALSQVPSEQTMPRSILRVPYPVAAGDAGATTDRAAQDRHMALPKQCRECGAGGATTAVDRTHNTMIETMTGPMWAPPGYNSNHNGNKGNHNGTGIATSKRYDVSDVSKLRDYGSYDIAYNLPLLLQLHNTAPDAATAFLIRKFARALQRFADVTEHLSRIGENVLEGVNSSKRFIIGSLVSSRLLKRLHDDFRELAIADEERGVQELLMKAQAQYMTEKGGVEQDVRHMIRLFSSFPCRPKKSDDLVGTFPTDAWSRETRQEREFRLRFPFISLPKSDPATASAAKDFNGCTRLYFTSYLHVEGVLQCLFESATVEGFSRPSKDEMEATHQLYMRHLIFKIFRRRNVSFTEAEVTHAFRNLNLLFRSDVEYDKQQRDLRRGLSSIYHSMYYVSMEVYLSLGDADEGHTGEADEFPLFTLNHNAGDSVAQADQNGSDSGASEAGSAIPSAAGAKEGREEREMTSTAHKLDEAGCSTTIALSPSAAVQARSAKWVLPSPSVTAVPKAGDENFLLLARSPLYTSRALSTVLSKGTTTEAALNAEAATATTMTSIVEFPMLPVVGGSAKAAADGNDSVAGSDVASPTRTRRRTANLSTSFTAPPAAKKAKKRPRSAGPVTSAKESVKEATVLVTPEAGRRTAVVQEMRHRVLNVTPMRRVHEGLSLNDFVLLMKEVDSAVRSQTTSSSHY